MAAAVTIPIKDGGQLSCVRIASGFFLCESDLRHVVLIILGRKKQICSADAPLAQLLTAHMFGFLEIFVESTTLWAAFGINSSGLPERGQTVQPERALALLLRVPEGHLLGLNWTFPGSDGGYSLLHRSCDPTLEEFAEEVALALLGRSDFQECNAKKYGVTALHFMAARGWAEACSRLIERTDFVETLSWVHECIESSNGIFFHSGDTVLDVARSQNHPHVVQAVRQTLAAKNKAALARHGVAHF
eukprot:TRINITY_DN53280_c0_g1_i2.p1 TRINITY_DN53280_c0_g1~~TRINITY_DN53280_c0_g1_i2.p1  ORF type:complete len:246 (-),score=39.16 TRINITY_DN53280_c0_g1_i2:406-1143(-)